MRRLIHFSVNLSDFVWRVSDVSDAILFCFFLTYQKLVPYWTISRIFLRLLFSFISSKCCKSANETMKGQHSSKWLDCVCRERDIVHRERDRERLSRILTKSPPIWTFSHLIDESIIRQDPRRLSYHAHVNDRIPWPLNCLSHHHHLASCIVSFNELEKLHVQFPDDNNKKKSQRKTSETRNGKQAK